MGVAYWWWTTVATQKYFGATGGQLSVLTIGHCPVRFCPLPLLGPPLLSRSRLVLVYVAFSDSYQALVLDSLKPKSSGQGRHRTTMSQSTRARTRVKLASWRTTEKTANGKQEPHRTTMSHSSRARARVKSPSWRTTETTANNKQQKTNTK